MCYSYDNKDFGRSTRKEADRQPEAKQETPEKPVKARDFTFWAFPDWLRTPAPRSPSAERSEERV